MLIGLIGAGGLVGQTIIQCLQNDNTFNSKQFEFKFYTRETKLNQVYTIFNQSITIQQFILSDLITFEFDFIILATDNSISIEIIDFIKLFNLKTKFIDLSSEFRLEPDIPLVIPEVNPEDINSTSNIISSPNCTTTFLVMLLKSLEPLGIIKRVIVSTYQSASGAGINGLEELKQQARDWVINENINDVTKTFWGRPLLFNVFSHNTSIQSNLYNSEEMKIVKETKKILHNDKIKIIPTCVRVPVLTSHCESVNIEFDRNITKKDIIDKLEKFPGIKIIDDNLTNTFPEPFNCSGLNDIFVGRIRPDLDDNNCWNFFLCGDQLIKGSGLNAIQILKILIKKIEIYK
jgi:aspartate-semialdehyde dehydrogenase